MSHAVFNPDVKNVIDQLLLDIPGITPGKMFGYPAYSIGRKLFACVYENGVGIKVPEQVAESLAGNEGITCFQPLGRARMKAWLYLSYDNPQGYRMHLPLFLTSIGYVSSLEAERNIRKT